VPDDVVARAAGRVRVLRLPERVELSEREFVAELLRSDATCLGEQHANARDHYAELWVLERSDRQAKNLGLELGVGFEMFQQPYQSVLSEYQRGHISEEDLLRRTEYERRWGHPFAYYRTLLEAARARRLPLVALNARRELTRAVREGGLDSLNAQRAYELPGLDLDDRQHRADFERRMQGHPGLTRATLEKYYQAQVVWDEAMAERVARWLSAHAPVRRMLIIAGEAHCQRSAIPARTERRGDFDVRSVLLGDGEPDPAAAASYDYALIVEKR
jgi:uncharacterized iron-regulated protein